MSNLTKARKRVKPGRSVRLVVPLKNPFTYNTGNYTWPLGRLGVPRPQPRVRAT
jgi:hypothetical protein